MKKSLIKILSIVTSGMMLATSAFSVSALEYGEEYKNMGQGDPVEKPIYSDVPMTHWAYDSIKRCADKNWFSGYPDGSFRPNGSITRAEAMTVFVKFLGLNTVPVTSTSYNDVNASDWYAPYNEAGKGLIPTVTNFDGSVPYRPEMPVTREDTMYALVTALGYASETVIADQSVLNMFSDANSLSSICKPYVAVGVSKKLISGYDDGRIGGQDPLTRAQFAAMLDRASYVGFSSSGPWGGASTTPGQQVTPPDVNPNPPTTAPIVNEGLGNIRGSVISAVDRSPIQGATVSVNNLTAVTDASGIYQIANINAGTYTASASAAGYVNGSAQVTVNAGTTTDAEPILLTQGTGEGTIHGCVYDASTGNGMANVKITLKGNDIEKVVNSGEDGSYTVSLPVGNYVAIATYTDYIPQTKTVVSQVNQNMTQDFTLTKILSSDQVRFVLTWGETPADLDSHITGPTVDNRGRFHVWYSDKDYKENSERIVNLDVDDVTSYGPETVTIYKRQNGTYRYSVHDYTNRGIATTQLSNSGAKVEVYLGGYLVKTYNVPANVTANLWTVCEFDGTNITDINTMSTESFNDVATLTEVGEPLATAAPSLGSSDAALIYQDLPEK